MSFLPICFGLITHFCTTNESHLFCRSLRWQFFFEFWSPKLSCKDPSSSPNYGSAIHPGLGFRHVQCIEITVIRNRGKNLFQKDEITTEYDGYCKYVRALWASSSRCLNRIEFQWFIKEDSKFYPRCETTSRQGLCWHLINL